MKRFFKVGTGVLLVFLFLLAAFGLRGDDLTKAEEETGETHGFYRENLARLSGVRVTADSVEKESFAPSLAADGKEDGASRWSSANEPGQPEHWLMVEFPEERTVTFVRLSWERLNVQGFVLEASRDGENWIETGVWEGVPEANVQSVVLENGVSGRFFRIRTTAVSTTEENQYLYYQNVSLLEMELYEEVPLVYSLEIPEIEVMEDGRRFLPLPRVPEGYEIALLGADYEEIIGDDGTVYPTVEEKNVTVGYRVSREGLYEDSPAYTVTVPPAADREEEQTHPAGAEEEQTHPAGAEKEQAKPAGEEEEHAASDGAEVVSAEEEVNSRPEITPALTEWKGKKGFFTVENSGRLVLQSGREEELTEAAEEWKDIWNSLAGGDLTVVSGTEDALEKGDIYLGFADSSMGLREEGYRCDISRESIRLKAEKEQGLLWGTGTLKQLLLKVQEGAQGIPCGVIRDYPRYAVRGFAIDIGRRMVSMDTLKQIVLYMSDNKMNNLGIHLNDNEILATSGKNDTIANAFTAYAGFRLESDTRNKKGEGITSLDGALTKEEWKAFTRWAQGKGVQVIPEIDTPAHSLSITRVFPEYALADEPDNVDHLDLSKKGTLELVQTIWKEYLEGEDPVFPEEGVVHIGLDEYYGSGEDLRKFANEMIAMVQESGRSVRLWGSLSRADGKTKVVSDKVQMQIWSTEWADPEDMYEAGFSIINSLNSNLYIIPGGGYDRLDTQALQQWEPNRFSTGARAEVLPAYSPRMAGAVYCLWNDTIGSLDVGITEEGMLERFLEPLPLLSEKLW